MRALPLAAALAAVLAALAVPALAQGAGEQRYALQPFEGGYARVDRATGEISTCTQVGAGAGSQLVCRMAADERSALEEQIAALEERVAALEAGGGTGAALPTDEEMDRAIGLMERFMRGFVGVVRELDEPADPRS